MTDSHDEIADHAEIGMVYVLTVADRPGIVHAITAVFANRGLSMRSLVTDTDRKPSRILVVFRGSRRQCRMVERVLARLHDVQMLTALPEDASELRAIAVCRASAPLPDATGVEVQQLGGNCALSGTYAAVEAAVARFTDEGRISEVSRTLMAL